MVVDRFACLCLLHQMQRLAVGRSDATHIPVEGDPAGEVAEVRVIGPVWWLGTLRGLLHCFNLAGLDKKRQPMILKLYCREIK